MSYRRNLESLAEKPVERLLLLIGERDVVALFGGRATLGTISNWKAGRRNLPEWAIDRLRQRWDELDKVAREDLARAPRGPGLSAGAKNLAAYLQRKSRTTKPGPS